MQNHQPNLRTSSYFLSPSGLLVFRTVVLLYVLAFIPIDLVYMFSGWKWFKFLTHWSWLGIIFYYTVAATLSVLELKNIAYSKWLDISFDALFAMAITCVWIVSVGFWGLLNKQFMNASTALGKFDSLNPHLFNLILMLAEIMLSRTILSPYAFLYPLLIS